jgi:hypothetical protein
MAAKIVGKDWAVFLDEESLLWDFDGTSDQGLVVIGMLSDHFSANELANHRESTMEYGREFGMLYPMAAEFLNTWGIKCEVEGLGPIQFEALPPAD